MNAIIGIILQLSLFFIIPNLAQADARSTSDQVFMTMGIYAVFFLILIAFFWPQSERFPINSLVMLNGFIIAIAIRPILLDVDSIWRCFVS